MEVSHRFTRSRTVNSVASAHIRALTLGLAALLAFVVAVPLAITGTPQAAQAADPDDLKLEFVITQTTNTVSFTVGNHSELTVDWGDGTEAEIIDASLGSTNITHTFDAPLSEPETKTVTVSGNSLGSFGTCDAPDDTTADTTLTKILAWGSMGLTSLECAGLNRTALTAVPTYLPTTVTDLDRAFEGASAFNQALGTWNISTVTTMTSMFRGSGLKNANYSATLIGWAPQFVKANVGLEAPTGVTAEGCAAIAARAVLLNAPNNWLITDTDPTESCGDPIVLVFDISSVDNSELAQFHLGGTVTGAQVNWGDGTSPLSASAGLNGYTYAAGTYKAIISATQIDRFGSCDWWPQTNTNLRQVLSWGSVGLTSLECALAFRYNIDTVPTSIPETVTTIDRMFDTAYYFDQDLSNWDTSNVTSMNEVFRNTDFTNEGQPLLWETHNVQHMKGMFKFAQKFNAEISAWNTGSVTDMSHMFEGATTFNANISGWNTGNVTDISDMFNRATSFNRNLGAWNISKVTDMQHTFAPKVSISPSFPMGPMFPGGISGPSEPVMTYSLSDLNYSRTLVGWASQPVQQNVSLGASYNQAVGCDAVQARSTLINEAGWVITDKAPTDTVPTGGCQSMVLEFTTSTADEEAVIGLGGQLTNVVIDWGESSSNDAPTNTVYDAQEVFAHTYSIPGTYRVTITGTELERFGWCGWTPGIWNLTKVLSWGTLDTKSLECGLYGRSQLTSVPATLPHTVTNIESLFEGAHIFNQDLSAWDTGNVTDMDGVFREAIAFNNGGKPLDWDTSNVISMVNMFSMAWAFNADIRSWNTGNVTDMSGMFSSAQSFDQSLGAWNISKVTAMTNMFEPAQLKTQVPSPTDTVAFGSVADEVPGSAQLQASIGRYALSDANYSATLDGWATQDVQPNVTLNASANQSTGCSAVAARSTLISAPNNWIIDDIAPTDEVPSGGCSSRVAASSYSHSLSNTGANPSNLLLFATGVAAAGVLLLLTLTAGRRRWARPPVEG